MLSLKECLKNVKMVVCLLMQINLLINLLISIYLFLLIHLVNLCVALPGTVATQICLDNIGQKFYDSGMAADLCARKILETPVKRK